MKAMKEEYGPLKGEGIFYASEKKGTIKGVEKKRRKKKKKMGDMGGGYGKVMKKKTKRM